MSENISFIDNSGDKDYFTMIPNVIVNGYNAIESGVYLYIKRKAGEDGEWFESKENTAKKLGISDNYFRKILRKLEVDKRIVCIGTKIVKTSPVKIYRICDIWKENSLQYDVKREPPSMRVSYHNIKREPPDKLATEPPDKLGKNNQYKEKPIILSLDKLLEAKQRHIQIIGLWAKQMELPLQNEDQIKSLIKRNVKAACLLKGYSDDIIKQTIELLKHTDYLKKFTLETVSKYVDEVNKQQKKDGPKIIRYERIVREGNVFMKPVYEAIIK